ncbi:hypothetical protein TNCV_589101 [Trichonephila clavipes]|nr:hypothetical protein TNCV_589101 [Trichonephila clavipes]
MWGSRQHFYTTCHSSFIVVVGMQHTVNMVAPLSTCSMEERRTVIRFLFGEGVKNLRKLIVAYKGSIVTAVYREARSMNG